MIMADEEKPRLKGPLAVLLAMVCFPEDDFLKTLIDYEAINNKDAADSLRDFLEKSGKKIS